MADAYWGGGVADAYERWLVPAIYAPFAEVLAARISDFAPDRVLDVVARTGALAKELLARTDALVTAVDEHLGMVDVGRNEAPDADWHQADLLALSYPPPTFDVVASSLGVAHVPDKRAAFSQIRSCLRASGTFAFTTWAALDQHPLDAAVLHALEQRCPVIESNALASDHAYHEADAVAADLRDASMVLQEVSDVTREVEASSAAELARGYCLGTTLRNEIRAGDVAIDEMIECVGTEIRQRFGSGAVRVPVTARLWIARPVEDATP